MTTAHPATADAIVTIGYFDHLGHGIVSCVVVDDDHVTTYARPSRTDAAEDITWHVTAMVPFVPGADVSAVASMVDVVIGTGIVPTFGQTPTGDYTPGDDVQMWRDRMVSDTYAAGAAYHAESAMPLRVPTW